MSKFKVCTGTNCPHQRECLRARMFRADPESYPISIAGGTHIRPDYWAPSTCERVDETWDCRNFWQAPRPEPDEPPEPEVVWCPAPEVC